MEYTARHCLYKIHSVERIQSRNLFRIDPHSGSILVTYSLENTIDVKHVLTVIYHCQNDSQLAHTRLHITLQNGEPLDKRIMDSYRFTQEHYLVLFETSFLVNQIRTLLSLALIGNDQDGRRAKSNAHIVKGRDNERLPD